MGVNVGHSGDALVSQLLASDPDLRDLVQEFVDEFPNRVERIRAAYEALDWELLARLAHQLKGAGGSYGYPQISGLAAEMETHFKQHDAERFADWMQDLAQLAQAAQRGLNEST
jgi:HPt (histidine-containing phosphotransfer) domain-containing protein